MNNRPVTNINSVLLGDADNFQIFTPKGLTVEAYSDGGWHNAMALAGTERIKHEDKDGIITHTLTYNAKESDRAQLEQWRQRRIVAAYIDERGVRRVCGSPTYPLYLSYTWTEGMLAVQLRGSSEGYDPKARSFLL